jgi:hypothetical protein
MPGDELRNSKLTFHLPHSQLQATVDEVLAAQEHAKTLSLEQTREVGLLVTILLENTDL